MALGYTGTHISCGVRQLCGVSIAPFKDLCEFIKRIHGKGDPAYGMGEVSHALSSHFYYNGAGYKFLFSDNSRGNGQKFAAWIKDLNIGTVKTLESDFWYNPNMHNNTMIQVWVWTYNGRLPSDEEFNDYATKVLKFQPPYKLAVPSATIVTQAGAA